MKMISAPVAELFEGREAFSEDTLTALEAIDLHLKSHGGGVRSLRAMLVEEREALDEYLAGGGEDPAYHHTKIRAIEMVLNEVTG